MDNSDKLLDDPFAMILLGECEYHKRIAQRNNLKVILDNLVENIEIKEPEILLPNIVEIPIPEIVNTIVPLENKINITENVPIEDTEPLEVDNTQANMVMNKIRNKLKKRITLPPNLDMGEPYQRQELPPVIITEVKKPVTNISIKQKSTCCTKVLNQAGDIVPLSSI